MNFKNTTRAWGALSKTLHWLIVALIVVQWFIAERADELPNGLAKLQALGWHKSIGITVLMLAVVRWVWRAVNPVPSLEGLAKPWERRLSAVTHVLLYGLIFAIPLTGWMMSSARNFPVSWFKLFQLPDLVAPSDRTFHQMHDLHELLFNVLVGVAVLHALGALKHHFIDRNDLLKRMLPFGRVK